MSDIFHNLNSPRTFGVHIFICPPKKREKIGYQSQGTYGGIQPLAEGEREKTNGGAIPTFYVKGM